jgi:hypothetical protein
MDLRDIEQTLRRHGRRRWWPTRCRCGSRYPCGARLVALDERLREQSRAAVDWYPRDFAGQAGAANGTRRNAGHWRR